MEKTLKLMEERARQEEADRLARQQLLMMAAGPISNRSDYNQNSARSIGTGRGRQKTPRLRDGPPTARSARDGSVIPPNAARMSNQGYDWVQLWDPDEKAYYWYCESTQVAQWEVPGSENQQLIPYNDGENAGDDDSGYESAGAMTDLSTDHYESGDDFSYSNQGNNFDNIWQEYWDQQAQAKYWYNNQTVFFQ
jgi:hypothetical protein